MLLNFIFLALHLRLRRVFLPRFFEGRRVLRLPPANLRQGHAISI